MEAGSVTPILCPGDIVCTTYSRELEPESPSWFQSALAFGIRQAESFNDVDGQAKYTHTFIITSSAGKTFEALWTYRHQNIFSAYAGQPVLIGRHKQMTQAKAMMMHYRMQEKFGGHRYPAWRLPLFALMPRLLKYLPGKPVCSELAFWALCKVGLIDHWKGVTPSYVADAISRWKRFQKVYEGIMPERGKI
jgi:hypothetical protein